MDKQDYEKLKSKCWDKFCECRPTLCKAHPVRQVFNFVFDHIYHHNLTPDAEGEEMLTLSRTALQQRYAKNEKLKSGPRLSKYRQIAEFENSLLYALFGSKCLPDETKDETKEPKPAEPKYHVGDWVRVVSADKHGHIGQITEVEYEYGCNYYQVSGTEGWHFLEKNLEPYNEPDKQSRNLSQNIANCDKQLDNILKDGFREHNRLHIAAMALSGLLANPNNNAELYDNVADALHCADALIAESEKGGPNGED